MTAKRTLIAAFDAASVAVAALAVALVCAPQAHAYVDPSVMTYTIQALAGVAVALSAVFGVMWRRARKVLFKLFGIDENHGKTVEGQVEDCSECSVEERVTRKAAQPNLLKIEKKEKPLTWPKRFGFAICMMALLMFTYFVAAPYDIVGGNSDSLSFGLRHVWLIMLVFAFVVGTIIAFGISAIEGRAFNVIVGVVFALGFCGFLQAVALNSGLPLADGAAVQWSDFTPKMIVNAVIWIAVFVVCIVLVAKIPNITRVAFVVLAFALMVTQALGIGTYVKHDILLASEENYVTCDGLYDVSSNKNVVVFVVDTVDTDEVNKLIAEYPETFTGLDGFTYFDNSAGVAVPTCYALPFLISGERLQYDEIEQEYFDTRFTRSTFLQEVHDQGYSVDVYADCVYSAKDIYSGITNNFQPIESMPVNIFGTIEVLSKAAFYRDVPWAFKSFFWYYTDDISNGVLGGASLEDDQTIYTINDTQYYAELQERGLSIDNEDGTEGSFKLIHLSGSHVPYNMDENGNSVEVSSLDQQTRGTFKIIDSYISELKRLGVYDNTTFIITADHGSWDQTVQYLTSPSSPLIMVKPAGSTGEVQTVSTPVSQTDFHPTVIEAVGGDKSKYGEGMTYFDVEDNGRIRYYDMCRYPNEALISISDLDEYKIDGYVLDFNNWELTGKSWSVLHS